MAKQAKTNNKDTKVQQSFKESSKISNIIQRFTDGSMSQNMGQPRYMDMYDAPTFHEAQNLVASATQAFNSLPAKLRARFQNNPTKLLQFVNDEKNRDEAIELGLVPKPSTPEASPEPSSKTVTETTEEGAEK